MCFENRVVSILYRSFALVLGIVALLLDFGVFDGIFKMYKFLYFTILSNIFCVFLFLFLIIKTACDIKEKGIMGTTSVKGMVKGEIMISIILTMVVYHFILLPNALKINQLSSLKISDFILHYVMPFVTIFDWILFDEKGVLKFYDPILWTVGPCIYLQFVFIQAKFDLVNKIGVDINQYIYAFLDISIFGFLGVIENVCFIMMIFILMSYFIVEVDKIKI